MQEQGQVEKTEELQHQLEQTKKENDVEKAMREVENAEWEKEKMMWENEKAQWVNEKSNWEKERSAMLHQLNDAHASATAIVRDNLGQHFSFSQVEFLLTGKPAYHWSEDDISRAVSLRSLSPKAYKYLWEECRRVQISIAISLHLKSLG